MLKSKLEKEVISFKVQAGKDDKVFGRISQKQIKDALSKLGYNIDKKNIQIGDQVSSLGYHDIDVVLYKDIIAKIKIKLEK